MFTWCSRTRICSGKCVSSQGGAFGSESAQVFFEGRVTQNASAGRPKKIKLIRLIKILRIARANRAVKFSSGCLQNCGLEKSRGDRKNPLSTVGNVPSAERNAPPWQCTFRVLGRWEVEQWCACFAFVVRGMLHISKNGSS